MTAANTHKSLTLLHIYTNDKYFHLRQNQHERIENKALRLGVFQPVNQGRMLLLRRTIVRATVYTNKAARLVMVTQLLITSRFHCVRWTDRSTARYKTGERAAAKAARTPRPIMYGCANQTCLPRISKTAACRTACRIVVTPPCMLPLTVICTATAKTSTTIHAIHKACAARRTTVQLERPKLLLLLLLLLLLDFALSGTPKVHNCGTKNQSPAGAAVSR